MPFDEQQQQTCCCMQRILVGRCSRRIFCFVACANEANVYVLQRNIFVAEVFFGKLEQTCCEVTDVLIFLEILHHLPDEGAFAIRVAINSYRCHIPGHLFGFFFFGT